MTAPAGRPALWMMTGALAFAFMGSIAHALGPRCDWLLIALVRALVMFASSAFLARSAGIALVVFDPPTLWTRSLAGSFSLVCNFYAMTRLPVAEVLTLTNTYPLWIALLSVPLMRRSPTALEFAGVACGLVGVALIQRPHLGGDRLAASVALLSSVSTAVAMLGLHRLRGVDARAVVAHFAGTASLIAVACLLARRGMSDWSTPDPVTTVMLFGVGATGTVGQYFLTKAYSAGVPTRVSVIGLSQVVFAMILDAALWGRMMTGLALAGACLILAPTAWLMLGAGRKPVADDSDASPPEDRADWDRDAPAGVRDLSAER